MSDDTPTAENLRDINPRRLTYEQLDVALDEAADRIEQLEAELRDTANAVEFEDDRIGYVSVQMDRDAWLKYREVQP